MSRQRWTPVARNVAFVTRSGPSALPVPGLRPHTDDMTEDTGDIAITDSPPSGTGRSSRRGLLITGIAMRCCPSPGSQRRSLSTATPRTRSPNGPDPSSYLPLPQAQFHVLVALTHGDRHGYAIMQDVETSSGGIVRMGPATLYGARKKLVDQGLAEELPNRPSTDDDLRRRYYRLTGLGRLVCVAEADRLAGLVRTTRANLRPGMA